MDNRRRLSPSEDGDSAARDTGSESRLDDLRRAIEQGLEDIKAGRVADVDAALDGVEAMLDELEAAKRPGG